MGDEESEFDLLHSFRLARMSAGRSLHWTVLMLGIRMIGYLEYVHPKGILSRDIGWANFAMVQGIEENSNTLYMFDFRLAEMYTIALAGRTGHLRDPHTE